MSDVWSWGILAWELVTGKDAWGHVGHPRYIRLDILDGKQLQWPDAAPPGFGDIQQLGQSALALDVDARPSSWQLLAVMNAVVATHGDGRPS